MAEAAFGYYPQLKPKRSQQDPEAAKNVPLDVLRGRIAGTLGAYGDVVNQPNAMVRPLQMLSQLLTKKDKYPDTDYFLENLPFKNEAPVSQAAGRVGSFVPMNPAPLARAAKAVPKMVGEVLNDRALKGQGLIPGLPGQPPVAMFAAPPGPSKATSLDDILSKVKHLDELGPADWPEHIARPISSDVVGYHVTQDITAPLKEGLLTNRSVGDKNIQGYVPEHVGGAYFWSDPQVARAQRERFFEMDPDFPEHEGPILKFKVNEGKHNFVPDEDTGAEKWRDSFTGGSFATKNPVEMEHLEAIYSGNPELTKDQIRKALASTEKATAPNQPFWYNPSNKQMATFEPSGMHNKVAQDPEFTAKLGATPEEVMHEQSPMIMGRHRGEKLDLMQMTPPSDLSLATLREMIAQRKLSPESVNFSAGENLFEGIPKDELLKAEKLQELEQYKKYKDGGSVKSVRKAMKQKLHGYLT